jgi:hypothetical protein
VLYRPYYQRVSQLQLTVPEVDIPKSSLAELVDKCKIADIGAARKPRLAVIMILKRCNGHLAPTASRAH